MVLWAMVRVKDINKIQSSRPKAGPPRAENLKNQKYGVNYTEILSVIQAYFLFFYCSIICIN